MEHWEAERSRGRPVPDGYLDRPELTPTEAFYWDAFRNLGTERQTGMAIGPIPWSKAMDYAVSEGLSDPDSVASFWSIISDVDAEYLQSVNAAASERSGKTPPQPGPLARALSKRKTGKA